MSALAPYLGAERVMMKVDGCDHLAFYWVWSPAGLVGRMTLRRGLCVKNKVKISCVFFYGVQRSTFLLDI